MFILDSFQVASIFFLPTPQNKKYNNTNEEIYGLYQYLLCIAQSTFNLFYFIFDTQKCTIIKQYNITNSSLNTRFLRAKFLITFL